MMPFCNNLRKGDVVKNVRTQREGVVHMQPRETSVRVCVLLNDVATPQYFPVGELRLVVDGKVVENVPPIDGEIPTWKLPVSAAMDKQLREAHAVHERPLMFTIPKADHDRLVAIEKAAERLATAVTKRMSAEEPDDCAVWELFQAHLALEKALN